MTLHIILALALAGILSLSTPAQASPVETCLDHPTVSCLVAHFGKGADLGWLSSDKEHGTQTAWLISDLLTLGERDEAEQVARREVVFRFQPDRARDLAVTRFLTTARSGVPDFRLLDALPRSDLAPLMGTSRPEDTIWSAYMGSGFALLRDLAIAAGVDDPQDAPLAMRTALRLSPAWQGVVAGLQRWMELRPPIHHPLGWRILAKFHLTVGDTAAARQALNNNLLNVASRDEVELWWRLDEPDRASIRVRTAGELGALGAHLEQVAAAATARADTAGALTALEEAWSSAFKTEPYRSPDLHHVRRLVRLTAGAGARELAVERARSVRERVTGRPPWEEAHWVDAASFLNDVGAHQDARVLLLELISLRPADLAAAGLGPPVPARSSGRRLERTTLLRAGLELARAGWHEPAQSLVRATLPEQPGKEPTIEDIEAMLAQSGARASRAQAQTLVEGALDRRLNWGWDVALPNATTWSQELQHASLWPEQVEKLLSLAPLLPDREHAHLLLSAAEADARLGRQELAAVRLEWAVALLAEVDQAYRPLCRAMSEAAKLGRSAIKDAAFAAAVRTARAEPSGARAPILLNAAACRLIAGHLRPRPYATRPR